MSKLYNFLENTLWILVSLTAIVTSIATILILLNLYGVVTLIISFFVTGIWKWILIGFSILSFYVNWQLDKNYDNNGK